MYGGPFLCSFSAFSTTSKREEKRKRNGEKGHKYTIWNKGIQIGSEKTRVFAGLSKREIEEKSWLNYFQKASVSLRARKLVFQMHGRVTEKRNIDYLFGICFDHFSNLPREAKMSNAGIFFLG